MQIKLQATRLFLVAPDSRGADVLQISLTASGQERSISEFEVNIAVWKQGFGSLAGGLHPAAPLQEQQ
ncbi:MAG: hypothetical protein ACREOU_16720 [Candidatus Eiseniibacteriota bacterium]